MKHFRLLAKTRQTTEYSCGACSLQSVLSYWGKDIDEEDLMRLLGTTPEDGTYPEDIVRVARSLGFTAELKSQLTLQEIQQATAAGEPVMVLGQAWRSERPPDAPMSEEWDSGHWFIALAVDADYVYFQDPYVRMGKGFMPRQTFEDCWHNVMGGDLGKPKQMRMAIFIRGDRAVASRPRRGVDLAKLDFSKTGSLNLFVTRFEGNPMAFDYVSEVRQVLGGGAIRAAAFILMRKDPQGRLTVVEGGNLEEEQDVLNIDLVLEALAAMRVGDGTPTRTLAEYSPASSADGEFGLGLSELHRIGEKLPPAHVAVIVLFENLWERRFREITASYKGTVMNQQLISPDMLSQLEQALRKGAGAAS